MTLRPTDHLVRLIRPRWREGAAAGVCLLVAAATTVAYAWLAGPLLGTILRGEDIRRTLSLLGPLDLGLVGRASPLVLLVCAVLLVALVRAGATFGHTVLLARVQQTFMRDLRVEAHARLLAADPAALAQHAGGALGVRLATDVERVAFVLNFGVAALVRQAATAAGLIVFAARLDGWLALVALTAVPAAGYLLWRSARAARAASDATWEEEARMVGVATEAIRQVPLVQAFGAEPAAATRFFARADAVRQRQLGLARAGAVALSSVEVVGAGALGGALLIASARVESGALDLESYISFFAAMALLYRPMQALGTTALNLAGGLAALGRVGRLLDLAPVRTGAGRPRRATLERALVLRDVCVCRGGAPVLDGVELEVGRGESLAVVGRSGAGKTTLLAALLGLVPLARGRIAIDGADLDTLDGPSRRALFAWVPQEPVLFAESLLANVALGDPAPDRARALRALGDAGFGEVLARLPAGLDAVLLEGGVDLSVGERQRVCIARALYREAPILLLDEPTAALDGEAERALGDTIDALLETRTVVLVSHRPSTVRRASRVVVLEAGRVVDAGTPAELWARPGPARALFAVDAAAV